MRHSSLKLVGAPCATAAVEALGWREDRGRRVAGAQHLYLRALTICDPVRRHGYAASFVAIFTSFRALSEPAPPGMHPADQNTRATHSQRIVPVRAFSDADEGYGGIVQPAEP